MPSTITKVQVKDNTPGSHNREEILDPRIENTFAALGFEKQTLII